MSFKYLTLKDHAWRGLLLGYFSILIFSTRAFSFCPGLNVTTRRAEIGNQLVTAHAGHGCNILQPLSINAGRYQTDRKHQERHNFHRKTPIKSHVRKIITICYLMGDF